ncbi:MAG: CAP domain-containing protein [Erysipelotrichaceae bacterium]|nr:CAP domain-containing protein [Erysipelotrichaceae bacterium]MCI9313280.1 CAP domain-containing protein [Erysipelotrichaceae bacterium]
MRGKSVLWTLAVLFVLQSDMALLEQFDFRFSLAQDEVHVEVGSIEQFTPYAYLLQNRHPLEETYQQRFPAVGEVDVATIGEYSVSYHRDMTLRVIVEDTTPPQLSLNDLNLAYNAAFSWNDETKAQIVAALSDNETELSVLQDNLECEDVDTSISGKRNVLCQVNDNSGNITSTFLAVNVQSAPSTTHTPVTANNSGVLSIPGIYYGGFETVQIKEVANQVNRYRSAAGLAPVMLDLGLYHNVTYLRALEVASKFSHTRPNGKPCHTIYAEYGLGYGSEGENIARGQVSAQEVVSDWMNSPTHRENILRPEFTRMSVGLVNSGGVWVWVQEFFS